MAREGVGESQFRRLEKKLGDVHCGTLYINVLCGRAGQLYSKMCTLGKNVTYVRNAVFNTTYKSAKNALLSVGALILRHKREKSSQM
jgi:hypothetical protein